MGTSMAQDFFTPYAVGGAAARPDSFTGMSDPFQQALMRMLQDAPEEVRLGITSGYRSPETQQRLWEQALQKYGSEAEARKWVAPPGRSQHNHGNAADLEFITPEARQWVHENAQRYGLAFPLDNEDWHVELATARGEPNAFQGQNALSAAPTQGNALSTAGQTAAPSMATRKAPKWVGAIRPPQVTFEPLTIPRLS